MIAARRVKVECQMMFMTMFYFHVVMVVTVVGSFFMTVGRQYNCGGRYRMHARQAGAFQRDGQCLRMQAKVSESAPQWKWNWKQQFQGESHVSISTYQPVEIR
jgi:hypothetical protein